MTDCQFFFDDQLPFSLRSKLEDSETGPLNSPVSQDDPDNQSTDSECVVSDPCGYHLNDEDEDTSTPDKKVSFVNCEKQDAFDPDGLKKKR